MLTSSHCHPEIRWVKTRLGDKVTYKAKAPVRRNTLCRVVAAPTVKRGFVMSELIQPPLRALAWFWADGLVREAGRTALYVFLSSAHPLRVETRWVVPSLTEEPNTMARTLTLARKPAPTLSTADTILPNAQEHIQAAQLSLEKALQALSGDTYTAAEIQIATGRAIRAATLLKRVCKALDVNTSKVA